MIYLDHSASARPWPAVAACFAGQIEHCYANPSSLHRLGHEAEKVIEESLHSMADTLGCQAGEVVLTSGGSESSNMAIKGFCAAHQRLGRRVITSRGEHAATRESCAWLKGQGYEITEIPLLPDGTVNLADLAEALTKPAALISLIHVSNETGATNPVEAIVRLRNQLQPDTAIHLDAVQTFGRLPFHFRQSGVDLVSGSGHKVGSPKGIGWLIVRGKTRLEPLIHGGGQQQGRRSGTENPPLAAAAALALRLACADLDEKARLVGSLRQHYLSSLADAGVQFRVLSPEQGVPHILTIAFPGLPGRAMLQALEEKDIMVSTGAACSSRKSSASPILRAMGLPESLSACAIRISLNTTNTDEEIAQAAQATIEICRKYIR